MTNSRAKGARGELEASKEWARVMGGTARRGQQFSGGKESPDVVCSHENLHLEVKRCEVGNPYVWMDQAIRDAGDKVPVVLHRRNGRDWLLIVRLDDAPRLAQEVSSPAEAVGKWEIPTALSGEDLPPATQGDEPDAGLLAVRPGGGEGDHMFVEHARPGQPDRFFR